MVGELLLQIMKPSTNLYSVASFTGDLSYQDIKILASYLLRFLLLFLPAEVMQRYLGAPVHLNIQFLRSLNFLICSLTHSLELSHL